MLVLAAAVLAVLAGVCPSEGASDGRPSSPASPETAAEDLVRIGTEPVFVRRGDLTGDGTEELVIVSFEQRPQGTVPYLEVFRLENGQWIRAFDATGDAPPGAGAPDQMLVPPEDGFVSQSVRTLRLIDFASDGRPEIVAGIQTFGAGQGPLELWVISMADDGALRTEFYRSSSRGGDVVKVRGDRVRFQYHVYRKDDPGCCPTFTDTVIIGWNPATERIEVLERTRRRSGLGLG